MKILSALIIVLLTIQLTRGQETAGKDTSNSKIYNTEEQIPEFPGGFQGFGTYISKNLKYPPVARLLGIAGKVRVSFVVDKTGKVVNIHPDNCMGAGCESEAVRILEDCPSWKPGIQDGRPVNVQFSVPISFSLGKGDGKAYMGNLRNSDYGFVFNIKGKLYTLDEAQKIIGDSFLSNDIEIAEPFYNYDKIAKFDMPEKKEVYLVVMKAG